jgi:hypothetical protein
VNAGKRRSVLSATVVSTCSLIISMIALGATVFQASLNWQVRNRSIESTIFQRQIETCTEVIDRIQVFSNLNAELRVLLAQNQHAVPANVSIDKTDRGLMIKPEELPNLTKQKAVDHAESGAKAYNYINTVRHVFGSPLKEKIIYAQKAIQILISEPEGNVRTATPDELNLVLSKIIGDCSKLVDSYRLSSI